MLANRECWLGRVEDDVDVVLPLPLSEPIQLRPAAQGLELLGCYVLTRGPIGEPLAAGSRHEVSLPAEVRIAPPATGMGSEM